MELKDKARYAVSVGLKQDDYMRLSALKLQGFKIIDVFLVGIEEIEQRAKNINKSS